MTTIVTTIVTITGTKAIRTKRRLRYLFPSLAFLLLSVSGCVRYKPSPVAEQEMLVRFAQRTLAEPGLMDFAEKVRSESVTQGLCYDPSDGLSLAEAEIAMLFLNPAMAVERARLGIARAVESTAGRLDDPVLSLEASRLLENSSSASNPWDSRVGLGFVLPVSGRLGVEKDLATAEAEEARRRFLLVQREHLQRLRRLWLEYSEVAEARTLLKIYLNDLREITTLADRLAEQDIIPRTEARLLRIELLEREAERQRRDSHLDILRLQLLQTIGVHASTNVELIPTMEAPIPADIDEQTMVEQHPKLAMMRSKLAVAEQAFRLEVRRQYPDLSLGPFGAEDDGNWRLGVGLSLPLAAWNRNARGLAEAEAARDAARAEYEAALLSLFADTDKLRIEIDASDERLGFLRGELLPVVAEQIRDARRLAELGSVDVLLLREALSMNYETRVRLLTSQREAAELRWVFASHFAPTHAIPTIHNESCK